MEVVLVVIGEGTGGTAATGAEVERGGEMAGVLAGGAGAGTAEAGGAGGCRTGIATPGTAEVVVGPFGEPIRGTMSVTPGVGVTGTPKSMMLLVDETGGAAGAAGDWFGTPRSIMPVLDELGTAVSARVKKIDGLVVVGKAAEVALTCGTAGMLEMVEL